MKKPIPFDELKRLHEKGWSYQQLANHFGVSKATVRRRLKSGAGKKDKPTLDFASRLAALAADAPNEYCRNEIMSAVHLIRSRHSLSRDEKKSRVLESLRTGARTIEDIADDLGYRYKSGVQKIYRTVKTDIAELLEELIAEKIVVKESPGGLKNRGRSIKFNFVLSAI